VRAVKVEGTVVPVHRSKKQTPHIFILSTTWLSVVSFMPWSLYHQWKKPQVSCE